MTSGEFGSILRARAEPLHEALFAGIEAVRYVDFPDYPNVGDSAIALGQRAFLRRMAVSVMSCHAIGTLSKKVYDSEVPLVINGGGNIAGFFRGIDEHRYRLAERLRKDTLLVQGPQSIHLPSETIRNEFVQRFLSRGALRLAVRDQTAVNLLADLGYSPLLVPDAAHLLGPIDVPPPRQSFVILRRADRESAQSRIDTESADDAFDWPRDTRAMKSATWLRWKVRYLGPAGQFLNPSPAHWERIAEFRLARGLALIAAGETVITDRLHGMILALQCGRRVVAVDNANQKLTKYATTWLNDAPVDFASDFNHARHLADRRLR